MPTDPFLTLPGNTLPRNGGAPKASPFSRTGLMASGTGAVRMISYGGKALYPSLIPPRRDAGSTTADDDVNLSPPSALNPVHWNQPYHAYWSGDQLIEHDTSTVVPVVPETAPPQDEFPAMRAHHVDPLTGRVSQSWTHRFNASELSGFGNPYTLKSALVHVAHPKIPNMVLRSSYPQFSGITTSSPQIWMSYWLLNQSGAVDGGRFARTYVGPPWDGENASEGIEPGFKIQGFINYSPRFDDPDATWPSWVQSGVKYANFEYLYGDAWMDGAGWMYHNGHGPILSADFTDRWNRILHMYGGSGQGLLYLFPPDNPTANRISGSALHTGVNDRHVFLTINEELGSTDPGIDVGTIKAGGSYHAWAHEIRAMYQGQVVQSWPGPAAEILKLNADGTYRREPLGGTDRDLHIGPCDGDIFVYRVVEWNGDSTGNPNPSPMHVNALVWVWKESSQQYEHIFTVLRSTDDLLLAEHPVFGNSTIGNFRFGVITHAPGWEISPAAARICCKYLATGTLFPASYNAWNQGSLFITQRRIEAREEIFEDAPWHEWQNAFTSSSFWASKGQGQLGRSGIQFSHLTRAGTAQYCICLRDWYGIYPRTMVPPDALPYNDFIDEKPDGVPVSVADSTTQSLLTIPRNFRHVNFSELLKYQTLPTE